MNLKEIIDDVLISYKNKDIDLEQARDIILMEVGAYIHGKVKA